MTGGTDDRAPRATPGTRDAPATPAELTEMFEGRLPGLLGIVVDAWDGAVLRAHMPVTAAHLAPNGRLHAASVIALADTACGVGCRLNLPAESAGFATVDAATSFVGTAREGEVLVTAECVHAGRRTQVWTATVTDAATGRTLALYRCTQLLH